jgi:oligopeptide transport system ATP-binding protein
VSSPVLDVADLRVRFETARSDGGRGVVRAVDGVDFSVEAGETLGIVGESGSGKSVASLSLFGLVPTPPGVVSARRAHLAGRDLFAMSPRELRAVRGKEMALIFQDPLGALNPLMTVGRQIGEVVEAHENATREAARRRAHDALIEVGISDPGARVDAYPHEMSGGMRQRVMIAMALVCRPRLLVADEPTTALDVTVQAQILELLARIQHRHGTAIVLITHSLGVVAGACDRVSVMYAGRVVESAETHALFARPLHPYTRGLLASVPRIDGEPRARLVSIEGSPPAPGSATTACPFAPRCPLAVERCRTEVPPLETIEWSKDDGARDTRRAACFFAREAAGAST